MSSEWPIVRLEEITSVLGDGLHGTPQYDDSGSHFFINGSNLKDGRIYIDGATKRISKIEYEKHKKDLNNRTVLVSINGTIGNVALYNNEPVVLGKSACYFNVVEKVDKQFVRYIVTSRIFQDYISNLATGSTIKNVSLKLMRGFSFRLPPSSIQREISGVLKAIDDRISLLRETNQTLEAIAQALFKSWFVDFDPVRAKAEGRLPDGIDAATAALFPAAFEETELGMVPRGWVIGRLIDFAKLKGGKMLSKDHFCVDGEFPVYGGAGEMGRSNMSNAEGFVITVGRVGAYCGQYFWHSGKAWVNNNASHVIPHNLNYSVWLYQWLRSVDMDLIKKGAAQPFVSNGDIENLHIILPDASVIEEFVNVCEPLFERMSSVLVSISTLTNLRDTLLPRLISGQLPIADAETELEKAIT